MKPSILVIGGAGYIGTHMVRMLVENGYQPVVFDNLSTGHRETLPKEAIFIQGDLQQIEDLQHAFESFYFQAVMHFAAFSIVPESVQFPLKYYQNNVGAFLTLLELMLAFDVKRLIFSSTAAVYGEAKTSPITEETPQNPTNPYGRSKWMMEQLLRDVASVTPLKYVALRYFNAAGAHPTGLCGEAHHPETHLIPNLLNAAFSGKEFTLYGEDLPTRDGTCIRDYVHVQDLCNAHLLGLRHLEMGRESDVFNLGSQHGYSVREVIHSTEQIFNKHIRIRLAPRRAGDPAELIADASKACRILGWQPLENLESILRSAHKWHQNHHTIKEAILCAGRS